MEQSEQKIPESQPFNSGSPTILFDSVEVFHPPQTELERTFNFTANTIYYFEIESYTPFSTSFSMDIFCESPSGKLYHFYDYQARLDNNQSRIFFEYGAAESGSHTIRWLVQLTEPTNLRLYLEEYMPLSDYYDRFTLTPIDEDILFFTDIHRFSNSFNSMSYILTFQEDTEYWVNFFRVNPISPTDKQNMNFENPPVEMTITLGGTTYIYYPTIPTLDYALYNNLETILLNQMPESRHLSNSSFLLRFGSHLTNNATLEFNFPDPFFFNLNFAVVVFSPGVIGDGPDDNVNNSVPTDNNTFPIPDNSSIFNHTDTQNGLSLWISTRFFQMVDFLRLQFHWFAFGVSILLIGVGIYGYFQNKKQARKEKYVAKLEADL